MYDIRFKELSKFGLKKNHLKLISFFLNNVDKKFSVRELSKQVKIPVGRIYPYLNDLFSFHLIEKTVDNKTFFFLDDPETRFRKFLIDKDLELKEIQKNILDNLVSTYISQNFVIIKTNEEFFQTIYQMSKKVKILKAFSHTPTAILLEKSTNYWERQLFESYKKRISEKDVELYYLFDKNSLKERIVKNNKKLVAKNIKWLKEHKNVHLGVLDARDVISMVIAEREVLIGFSELKQRNVIRGLLFRSRELVNFFENFYDNLFEKSESIDSFKIAK